MLERLEEIESDYQAHVKTLIETGKPDKISKYYLDKLKKEPALKENPFFMLMYNYSLAKAYFKVGSKKISSAKSHNEKANRYWQQMKENISDDISYEMLVNKWESKIERQSEEIQKIQSQLEEAALYFQSSGSHSSTGTGEVKIPTSSSNSSLLSGHSSNVVPAANQKELKEQKKEKASDSLTPTVAKKNSKEKGKKSAGKEQEKKGTSLKLKEPKTSNVSPHLSLEEQQEQQERSRLLLEAPFRDMTHLVLTYNKLISDIQQIEGRRKKVEKINEPLLPLLKAQLSKIDRVIKEEIIPSMAPGRLWAIRQGIYLAGCNDQEIRRQLVNQLLTQIDSVKQDFPELYDALREIIKKQHQNPLSIGDAIHITQLLTDKMNDIHAPDLRLSCIMIQNLSLVLSGILKQEEQHIDSKQLKRIEEAINSLKWRLQAVKPKAPQPSEEKEESEEERLYKNIQQGVEFICHALAHDNIEDEKTKKMRCLHRLKIGGTLLLQAAEVGTQWAGAAGTMGVGAPSATMATVAFAGNAFRQGKEAYRFFHNNKKYFQALTTWQNDFEDYVVKGQWQEAKAHIKKLCKPDTSNKTQKQWLHTGFQLGTIDCLMAVYEFYPEIQNSILGLLHAYVEGVHERGKERDAWVRQQASYYLLLLNEQNKIVEKATKEKTHSLISSMTEQDKVLYDEYQKATILKERDKHNNLAFEAWGEKAPGDVKLFNIFSKLGEQQESYSLQDEHKQYFRDLIAGTASDALSYWGKMFVNTLSKQIAKQPTLKAFISQDIVLNRVGTEMPEMCKWLIEMGDKEEGMRLYRGIIGDITSGTAGQINKLKPTKEVEQMRQNEFDHFLDKVLSIPIETTTELRYYDDLVGTSLFENRESGDKRDTSQGETLAEADGRHVSGYRQSAQGSPSRGK